MAVGDRIIAGIDVNGNIGAQMSITGITDDQGNVWAKDGTAIQTNHGYFEEVSVWSAVSVGTSVTNITVAIDHNLSANSGIAIAAGAYSGLNTTSAVDIFKAGTGAGGAASPIDSGTTVGTTTAANELKIGVGGSPGNNITWGAGTLDTTYSIFAKIDGNGNAEVFLEDADSGSLGSTARATATYAGNIDNGGALVLVYKLASGGAAFVAAPPRIIRQAVNRAGTY